MTQSKKIALTGGIGSGKSLAATFLREAGYCVFSCDEIYAELCAEPTFLAKIGETFPGSVKHGGLDRAWLAKKVFSDGEVLKKLNALTHPAIMARLMERMERVPLSFAEVPLLFEGGYERLFDMVIVVVRERSARVEALKARDNLSEEEIAERMARQFDYSRLPEGCAILRNDGAPEDLRRELFALIEKRETL